MSESKSVQPDYASDLQELNRLAQRNKGMRIVFGVLFLVIVFVPTCIFLGFIINNCDQDWCQIIRDPTPTAPPVLEENGSPGIIVLPTITPSSTPSSPVTAPTTILGTLYVSQGIPCEAGTESWHIVTIQNTGTEGTSYILNIPDNAELYRDPTAADSRHCPDLDEPLQPLVRYNPIELAAGRTVTYTLKIRLPGKPGDTLKLTAATDLRAVLGEVTLELAQDVVGGYLGLADANAAPYFVQGYDSFVVLNFTADRPGRYQLSCKDASSNIVYESELPILITDETTFVAITCHLPALSEDQDETNEWQVEVHRLDREGKRYNQEEPAVADLLFTVEKPSYSLIITQNDYVGLIWGPSRDDVGLIVSYIFTYTGNTPVDLGILLVDINENVKPLQQMHYATLLKPVDVLDGEVESFETGESVTLKRQDSAAQTFIFISISDQAKPGWLNDTLPACVNQNNCPRIQLAIWLKTSALGSISTEKAVAYRLDFLLRDRTGSIVHTESWPEEFILPPERTIRNPNAR
jgi:hypothetical protein